MILAAPRGVAWAPHPCALGAPYYGLRLTYFVSTGSHVGALFDFTHYKMYAETAEPVAASGAGSRQGRASPCSSRASSTSAISTSTSIPGRGCTRA